MTKRIFLDARLPSELDDVATVATSADWVTIQKAGETILRRINPLDAIPPHSTDKLTSGTLSAARLPAIGTLNIQADAVTQYASVITEAEIALDYGTEPSTAWTRLQSFSFTPDYTGGYLVIACAVFRYSYSEGTQDEFYQVDWRLNRSAAVQWTLIANATGTTSPPGAGRSGGLVAYPHYRPCVAGTTESLTLDARLRRTSGTGSGSGTAESRALHILRLKR